MKMKNIELTYSPSRIVEGIANIEIPLYVFRQSNIKNIIPDIHKSQIEVKNSVDKLEQLRQEQKDGNFIGNWWKDRDDHVKDAQINLNKSIGKLTEKTSTLLVVNTAMAKQLNEQQNILLQQQKLLEQQTRDLKSQNNQISEQQKVLENQQREINLANQGLMEAKGVTQEQAMQLVGCVKLVKEAEGRIDAANHALRSDVKQDLRDSIAQYVERLDKVFSEQAKRNNFFEQKLNNNFSAQEQLIKRSLEKIVDEGDLQKTAIQEQLAATITTLKQQFETLEKHFNNSFSIQAKNINSELSIFSNESSEFKTRLEKNLHIYNKKIIAKILQQDATTKQLYDKFIGLEAIHNQQTQIQKAIETQLENLQVNYKKNAAGNRLAITGTAILSIFSVGWQVAQYFF